MPNLSPFVVVISLGQQVKGLVKGKACYKARNYWDEEEEEEDECEDFEEDTFTGSLPSIVDSLGNSQSLTLNIDC